MNKTELERNTEDLRITNVPKEIKEDLKTIAYNLGNSLTDFLRPRLNDIRNEYSEDMRKRKRL